MKKITFICSLAVLSTAAFGQSKMSKVTSADSRLVQHSATKNTNPQSTLKSGGTPSASPMATIWTNDFSVPSTWTINSPVGSGTASTWVIGTTGPTGFYAIPAILSTTAANGFAKFDSDLNCSGNQIADITTATPINCSANMFYNLTFQQQYRRFYDSTFVLVSNDGTTWTKYNVNQALTNNDYAVGGNPDNVTINISATAGGQATVWIRFQFYSPSSLGASAGCAYSWMVDDVAISEINPNDMKLDRAYADFSYVDGGYYTKTPTTQVAPITFRGAISNVGSTVQSGSMLNVNINDGTSSVYNQNSAAAAAIPYAGVDTLDITTPFTPAAMVKTYTATFMVDQTETELAADLANNTIVKTFAVTDSVYARDGGVAGGATSPNYYTGGDQDDARIGLLYEVLTADNASSISAWFNSSTAAGTAAQAKLYEIDGTGAFIEVAASTVYDFSTAPTAGWITFDLPTTPLTAGGAYIATIVTSGISSGPPDLFVILGNDMATQQPDGIAFIYLPGDDWYTIGELPMIRLNMEIPVGINENDNNVSMLQNSPNPATNNTVVTYSLANSSQNVTLSIVDVLGRTIATYNEGNKAAGQYSINVETASLEAGVYYYTLSAGKGSVAQKMVVTK